MVSTNENSQAEKSPDDQIASSSDATISMSFLKKIDLFAFVLTIQLGVYCLKKTMLHIL